MYIYICCKLYAEITLQCYSLVNIGKNQESELFTSQHFSNLSKTHGTVIEFNPTKKFKAIESTALTSPVFQIFFKKKDFSENVVIVGMGI